MEKTCYRCKVKYNSENNIKHNCSYHLLGYTEFNRKLVSLCCKKEVGSKGCVRQIHFEDKDEEATAIQKGYLIVKLEKIRATFEPDDPEMINNCLFISSILKDKEIKLMKKGSEIIKLKMDKILEEYKMMIPIETMDSNRVFETKAMFYSSDQFPDIEEYNKFKKNEFILLSPISTIRYSY